MMMFYLFADRIFAIQSKHAFLFLKCFGRLSGDDLSQLIFISAGVYAVEIIKQTHCLYYFTPLIPFILKYIEDTWIRSIHKYSFNIFSGRIQTNNEWP